MALADQHAVLRRSAHILVTWYNLSRLEEYGADDMQTLRLAAEALRRDWVDNFHVTGVKDLRRIPKFHRLVHVAESVTLFGPYKYLTTERSEASHKRLKQMYKTCVSSLLCVRVCLCIFMPLI